MMWALAVLVPLSSLRLLVTLEALPLRDIRRPRKGCPGCKWGLGFRIVISQVGYSTDDLTYEVLNPHPPGKPDV